MGAEATSVQWEISQLHQSWPLAGDQVSIHFFWAFGYSGTARRLLLQAFEH